MRGEAKETARRLPAGPHGIPPELVARNQRERLVAAIAEACAERGYADTSVTDVAKRAGVSTVTFYRLFADKRDCVLAAHRALLGRLLEEVDGVCEEAKVGEGAVRKGGPRVGEDGDRGREVKLRAAVHTVLSLLAADPPSARLLTVEILAAGPEGVKRHDAAVEALASRLRTGRRCDGHPSNATEETAVVVPPGEGGPRTSWVLVAGMFALIGKWVMAGEASRLPDLQDELVAMISLQS